MDDPYKILNVARDASADVIKRAYRELAKRHHPDVNEGSDSQFKTINGAYQVLSDPAKRRAYDRVPGVYGDLYRAYSDNLRNFYGGARKTSAERDPEAAKAEEINAVVDDFDRWCVKHPREAAPWATRVQMRKEAQQDYFNFRGFNPKIFGHPEIAPQRKADAWQWHLERKARIAAIKAGHAVRKKAGSARAAEERRKQEEAEQLAEVARKQEAARKQEEAVREQEAARKQEEARMTEATAHKQEQARKQESDGVRTVWRKCSRPSCHCMKPGGTLHGPYLYRKSRRVNGKVVTGYGGKPPPGEN